MMKRILSGCAAMVFVCAAALAQQSSTPSSQGSTQPQPKNQMGKQMSSMEKFVGSVQSVDPAAMTLSVKDSQGTTKDFVLTSTATIHKAKSVIPISGIKPGDRITVSYTGSLDNPVVQRVTIHSKKRAAGTGGAAGSGTGVKPSTSTSSGGSSGRGMGTPSGGVY